MIKRKTMKSYKTIQRMLLMILVLAVSYAARAQQANDAKQRVSREQFARVQAQNIAKHLKLDDATSAKFIETFENYRTDLRNLKSNTVRPKKGQQLTAGQVEQNIKARFAHSRQILDLRENYYDKYRKFLSPRQIQRVYDMEQHSMKRLADQNNAD